MMDDDASSIRVFVRLRPLSPAEAARPGGHAVAHVAGCSVAIDGAAAPFAFDGVFPPEATQADVYDAVGRPIVEGLFAGFNGCLLAYGQTGSGKTHSMVGPPGAALGPTAGAASGTLDAATGIIPRAVADIFATALGAPEECTFSIKASYVEIYQERVRDLLAPAPPPGSVAAAAAAADGGSSLAIGEDPARGGIYVKGAREEYVGSPAELLALMAAGNANRATAATGMNAGSSRSHAVFTLTLSTHDGASGVRSRSKLLLCDLAGSETVSKTGVTGRQLDELRTINKSLSALGLCVHALTEQAGAGGGAGGGGGGARSHVPYRDSKLTRLLQECLGGNARTALLCAASPSGWNAAETLSTLRFGTRAKRVRNHAVAHRERTPAETAKHADACEGALVALDAAAACALDALEALFLALPPPDGGATTASASAASSAAAAGGPLPPRAASLAAVAALLAARAHAGGVLTTSTSLPLALAAGTLVAAGGAGPPLGGAPLPAPSVAAAPGGGGGGAGGGGAQAQPLRVGVGAAAEPGARHPSGDAGVSSNRSSTDGGVGGGDGGCDASDNDGDDEEEVVGVRSAASVAAALEGAAAASNAHAPSVLSAASSGAVSLSTLGGGAAATDAVAGSTAGRGSSSSGGGGGSGGENEAAQLRSQLGDMLELLTEAGGEIGTLQARVAALEAALAAARGGVVGAPREVVEEKGEDDPTLSASGQSLDLAGGREGRGVASAVAAGTFAVSPSSSAGPLLNEEGEAGGAEAALLRAQLELATSELCDLRDALCESKARAQKLEDALLQLAGGGGDGDGDGGSDHGAGASYAGAMPAPPPAVAAAPAEAPAAPAASVGAASSPASLVSGVHDSALSKLSDELAARNALIGAYEGRLTSLMTRMADAVAAGDVTLLESAAGRRSGGGGGGGGGDARSDELAAAAGVGGGGSPFKSIRGRGGHRGPEVAALPYSPPRGYAQQQPPQHGGGDASSSPGESAGGLLGRLWRRVATAMTLPPDGGLFLPQQPPLPPHRPPPPVVVPAPTRRGGAPVSYTTSADLHLLSPSRASPAVVAATARAAGGSVAGGGAGTLSPAVGPDAAVLHAAPPPAAIAALARACELGDVAAVRAALATGPTSMTSPAVVAGGAGEGAAAIAATPDAHGRPAHLYACRGGHVDAVAAVVELAGRGVLAVVDRDGRNGLHYACRRGHAALVAWLLARSGSADGAATAAATTRDAHGLTPLHHAALGRAPAVVRLLLAAGADPAATDAQGATAGDLVERMLIGGAQGDGAGGTVAGAHGGGGCGPESGGGGGGADAGGCAAERLLALLEAPAHARVAHYSTS